LKFIDTKYLKRLITYYGKGRIDNVRGSKLVKYKPTSKVLKEYENYKRSVRSSKLKGQRTETIKKYQISTIFDHLIVQFGNQTKALLFEDLDSAIPGSLTEEKAYDCDYEEALEEVVYGEPPDGDLIDIKSDELSYYNLNLCNSNYLSLVIGKSTNTLIRTNAVPSDIECLTRKYKIYKRVMPNLLEEQDFIVYVGAGKISIEGFREVKKYQAKGIVNTIEFEGEKHHKQDLKIQSGRVYHKIVKRGDSLYKDKSRHAEKKVETIMSIPEKTLPEACITIQRKIREIYEKHGCNNTFQAPHEKSHAPKS